MGGEIDFMMSSTRAAMGPIKVGHLRPIAVTGPKRLALTPLASTVSESDAPGFVVMGRYRPIAPAGLPRDIGGRRNGEFIKAVHSASVKERFAALGTEPVGSAAQACTEFLREEITKWPKVVKAASARAD